MIVELIHKGKALRSLVHEGQTYLSTPKKGAYTIRLFNDSWATRLAVVTVDGVNVITGEEGDFKGQGYVIGPRKTLEIPGWRRDGDNVAAFVFRSEEASYAAQTGRGTKNVGVVGVAVFDEVPSVRITTNWIYPPVTTWIPTIQPYTYTTVGTLGTPASASGDVRTVYCANTGSATGSSSDSVVSSTYTVNAASPASASGTVNRSNRRGKGVHTLGLRGSSPGKSEEGEVQTAGSVVDVGTGYGHEVEFQTVTTTFNRATENPAEVLVLRYATLERLKSWGLPVDKLIRSDSQAQPKAFPASAGASVPAPPGWRG